MLPSARPSRHHFCKVVALSLMILVRAVLGESFAVSLRALLCHFSRSWSFSAPSQVAGNIQELGKFRVVLVVYGRI